MAQLILNTAVSLDGYIAGTKGETDWLQGDPNKYGFNEFYNSIGMTLMGYRTYEISKSFGEYPYKEKTNYVFSHLLRISPDPLQFITEDPVLFAKRMKKDFTSDIWLVGGGHINSLMLEVELIDTFMMYLIPVYLGKGIPVFRDTTRRHYFSLKSQRVFDDGVVELIYTKK